MLTLPLMLSVKLKANYSLYLTSIGYIFVQVKLSFSFVKPVTSIKVYLVFQNHYIIINMVNMLLFYYTACTILSLLMRCVVFVTKVISELRLCDHSFNTSLGSLVCWKLTMPAGRSILAYIVLLVTSRDTKSSTSFKIKLIAVTASIPARTNFRYLFW